MTKLSPAETVPNASMRCCAPTCANSPDNSDGVCFFRFPKDEERCKKWVANCGRADLVDKSAENLYANYRLCSAHFRKDCFSSTYHNRLVWNAVPTLFKHAAKVGGPPAAKAGAKAATSAKPTRAGIFTSQQRFRRFFGFASKRRTSVTLRPGTSLNPAVMYPPIQPRKEDEQDAASIVKPVEAEGPRLPVYIEDHLYAAHTAAVQPVFSTRFSMPSPSQSGVNRVHEIIVDHLDGDRLVMDVVEGGSIMDEKDAEAFKAAVEAALPLLQLSQQVPLGPPPPRQTMVVTTSTAPPAIPTKKPSVPRPRKQLAVDRAAPRSSRKESRRGPRMMQDFLLPHLDKGTFGERLQWVDRANGIFQIGWYHKNAAQWTKDDCVVFLEWDRLKKRPVAQNPHYWMEAKQRFRAALGKVTFGWAQPRCKATGGELKNVKVRKIKWTRDMRPPLGANWEPWDPSWAVVTKGRVHRPTISRVRRLSPSPSLADGGRGGGGRGEDGEEEGEETWGAYGDPCVCHRCGYTTRNRRVFLRHRMMHRDVRAFCCRYCPQRFCLPESLFLHLQVHSETFPYSCSTCGVKTRLLLQLWRHELRRLAQRLCLCHRCGLVCHVRENLKYHLAKAHGQGDAPAPNPNWKLAPVCSGELGRFVVPKPKNGRAKPTGGQKENVHKPKAANPNVGKPKVARPKPTKPRARKPKGVEKTAMSKPKADRIGGARGATKKLAPGRTNKPVIEKVNNKQKSAGLVFARKSVAIKVEPNKLESNKPESNKPETKLQSTGKPVAGRPTASKTGADAPATSKSVVGDEPKLSKLATGASETAEKPDTAADADVGQCETIELIINELRKSEPGAIKRKADDVAAAPEKRKKKTKAATTATVPLVATLPPVVLKVPTQTNHAGVVLAGMVTEQGLRRTQRIRTPKRKISA
ncbi:unnamed protein product [Ixodes hexagonus]